MVKAESETSLKADEQPTEVKLTNPFSIMLEISKACYLEEILFGKKNSTERTQISEFVELVERVTPEQLTDHINKHMAMRMFLVGENITAADIIVFAAMAPYMS